MPGPLRNLSTMTPLELAELPILPDAGMVDAKGRALRTVHRTPIANPAPGGPTHALVCHPDRESDLRASLAREAKRYKGSRS
jgi:hypothetical protein